MENLRYLKVVGMIDGKEVEIDLEDVYKIEDILGDNGGYMVNFKKGLDRRVSVTIESGQKIKKALLNMYGTSYLLC